MTFHNDVMLIKSVFNKDKNSYHYKKLFMDYLKNKFLHEICCIDWNDGFEEIDFNRKSTSKECDICHYCYF